MTEKKQKPLKKPQFLRGMFSTITAITLTILLLAWAIINYQVEQLVATRTSEYAHSIAQIAANSSADALMSGDKLQLKMLVENVAKDPYIRSATIFAEDGQIVAQYPEPEERQANATPPANNVNDNNASDNKNPPEAPKVDNENQATGLNANQTNAGIPAANVEGSTASQLETANSLDVEIEQQTQAYLQSQNDIPFIEKILYQQVTAGWFKISLNRQLLEQSFRESLQRSQNLIIAISAFLMIVLIFVVLKYEKRVKKIVSACHRLIQINSPKMPLDKKQWLTTLQELSETRFQSLTEHPTLPTDQSPWVKSERATDKIFCLCQFAMQEQQEDSTAACISRAEQYLQAAVNAYGVQTQGDLLSGCLIPFHESNDETEALTEAICLLHVVAELLASLELKITMKGVIGKGTLLTLENARGAVTGVSLSNRLQDKINKLLPVVQHDAIVALSIEPSLLESVGEFSAIDLGDDQAETTIVSNLENLSEPIKQQTNRQIQYIISDINS